LDGITVSRPVRTVRTAVEEEEEEEEEEEDEVEGAAAVALVVDVISASESRLIWSVSIPILALPPCDRLDT
jgi:CO dehydrogenase/acetyl-CoA synthase beta subunit